MGVNLRHRVLGMCSIVFTVAAINSNQSIHPVTRDQWRSCVVITEYIYVTPPPPGVRWSPDWVLIAITHQPLVPHSDQVLSQQSNGQKCWGLVTGDAGHNSALFEVLQDETCLVSESIYHNLTGYFCSIRGLMCLVWVISDVIPSAQKQESSVLRRESKSPEEVRDQVPAHFW